MKPPVRVKRAPAGNKAFVHTSAQVQYYAFVLACLWVEMPDEHKQSVMTYLGLTPSQMLLAGAGTWALATLLGKATSLRFWWQKGAPSEAEGRQ